MTRFFSLSAMLCLLLLFSCAPDIEPIPELPPPDKSSSSFDTDQSSSSLVKYSSSSSFSSNSNFSSSEGGLSSSSSSLQPSSSSSAPSSSSVYSSSSAPSSSSVAVPPLSSSATQCSSIGFAPDPDEVEKKNYMCARCDYINACGPDISAKLGWSVDFYILMRGNVQDTIWLNPTQNNECKGNAKDFTCYGGIRIEDARYSCGGAAMCRGNPTAAERVAFTGNANVYARLNDENGVQQGRVIQIDQFKRESDTEELSVKLTVTDP